jgi:acylphosphatase
MFHVKQCGTGAAWTGAQITAHFSPVSRETMANERSVCFHVTGLVQGVGFRWWTQRHAQRLDLRGSVRNLRDGSVEVRVSGPAESVGKLQDLLRRGPAGAQVDSLIETPAGTEELPYPFQIAR